MIDTFEIGRTFSRAWQIAIRSLPSAGLFLLIVTIAGKVLNMGAMFALKAQFQPAANGDRLAALKAMGSVSYLGLMLTSAALGAFMYAGTLHGLVEAVILPRRDLRGMHVKALRQFGERAFISNGREGHFGLERGSMIATGTSRHSELQCAGEQCRRWSPRVQLSDLFRIPQPLQCTCP